MCPESDRTCVKLDKGDTCCLNKNIVQQDDPPPPPTETPEQPSNNEVPPVTDKPVDDTPVVTKKPEATGMHFIFHSTVPGDAIPQSEYTLVSR